MITKHVCLSFWNSEQLLLFQTEFFTFSTTLNSKYEPAREIMALFVLRKPTLQTRTRSHPVRLDVRFLVGPFVYFHTSCVRTAKTLARLRGCVDSPEPSLVVYVISTIISRAGSYTTHTCKCTKTFTEV